MNAKIEQTTKRCQSLAQFLIALCVLGSAPIALSQGVVDGIYNLGDAHQKLADKSREHYRQGLEQSGMREDEQQGRGDNGWVVPKPTDEQRAQWRQERETYLARNRQTEANLNKLIGLAGQLRDQQWQELGRNQNSRAARDASKETIQLYKGLMEWRNKIRGNLDLPPVNGDSLPSWSKSGIGHDSATSAAANAAQESTRDATSSAVASAISSSTREASKPKPPSLRPSQPSHPSGGSSSMCFVAGSVVHMSSGICKIEDVQVGDQVLSWDERTGRVEPAVVLQTWKSQRDDLIKLYTAGGSVMCSQNHRFYTADKGWLAANQLKTGAKIMERDPAHPSRLLATTACGVTTMNLKFPVNVYNLTVAKNSDYFVGPDAVLCHNTK